MVRFKAGQIIKFTYKSRFKKPDGEPEDNYKEVLVLHPLWQNKVHGVDLKRLTPAERETLDAIMDPAQKGKQHQFPLVNDILKRMDPITEIKNPMSFYSKFVKVFLRNKDAYRTYYPPSMMSVVVVKKTAVKGTVFNPKPLFHKVESKPQKPSEPTKQPSRLDLIKARAEAQKSGQKPSTAAKPSGVRTSKEPQRPQISKADRMALIKQRAQLTRPKRPV